AVKIIQPASVGAVEFEFVPSGPGSVAVTPEGGKATSKDVSIDLAKGETVQTIPVALPEVTATVEPAAGAAPPANAPANAPAPTAAAPAAAPVAAPAAPAPYPYPPPETGGGWGSTLVGFIFLAALLFGGYVFARNKGITMEMVMQKLGVQPDAVAAGGGNLGGANYSIATASPGAPPAPPPVVADPNQCPFCGQMKDAAGNCACMVAPGGAAAGYAPASGVGGGAAGGGPRLVGMAGTYMGHVFPLGGSVVIGREATNPVPLDRDTTTSRRHAQLTADGGAYRIQDLGSANGTFVNGAKVTEAVLAPGDEVSIGGTRFRFEV
ncbi:MAG TPA: FHA domain-containing protein, partial [Armatimonadota bacterium]|nr:FHA domain-containing protein [Armatimonadota bacterium]